MSKEKKCPDCGAAAVKDSEHHRYHCGSMVDSGIFVQSFACMGHQLEQRTKELALARSTINSFLDWIYKDSRSRIVVEAEWDGWDEQINLLAAEVGKDSE